MKLFKILSKYYL